MWVNWGICILLNISVFSVHSVSPWFFCVIYFLVSSFTILGPHSAIPQTTVELLCGDVSPWLAGLHD